MDEQVIRALNSVSYRTLAEPEDLERIFRLRHQCYAAEGSILKNERGMMTDAFDESGNCVHVAVEIDGRILSSVRLHLVSSRWPISPTLEVFPELQAPLDRGETILDPTRFVVDPEARKKRVPLHFLALRIPVLATIWYDVDIAVAPVRPEHAAFYRRYLGHELALKERSYPGLTKPIQLLTARRSQREAVLAKSPVFGPLKDFPNANVDFPRIAGFAANATDGRHHAA